MPQTAIRRALALAVVGVIATVLQVLWIELSQPRYQRKTVAEWVDTASRSESDVEFLHAMDALGARSVPSLSKIALEASRDRSSRWNRWIGRLPREFRAFVPGALQWEVTHQRMALRGLGRVGKKEEEALGILLWAVSVPEISEAAANVLVRWKDRVLEHPAGMATIAMTSPHLACRTNALRVLWSLGRASESLMVSLRESPEPEVSLTSEIGQLYWRGQERLALETLDQLVFEENETSGRLKQLGVREKLALQILGWVGSGLEPMANLWVLRFREDSQASQREILSSLMEAMGAGDVDLGLREVMTDVLLEALDKETDMAARLGEIHALGSLGHGSHRVVDRLESLLQGSDEETIAASRRALERIRSRSKGG